MDSVTGSIYFGDPGVERHLIIRNAHSILPSLEVWLKMTIEWSQGYTPSPWSSQFGDALWGHNRAGLEMHLEATIERVWRCNWKPWSSKYGDTLGSCDRTCLEMQLEAIMVRVWRCTCRPWSSEIGGVLGGGQSGGGGFGREAQRERRRDRSGDCILWLTRNCANVENLVHLGLPRDQTGWEQETVNLGIMQYAVYAVLSGCCTRSMLYSVLTLDHGMER